MLKYNCFITHNIYLIESISFNRFYMFDFIIISKGKVVANDLLSELEEKYTSDCKLELQLKACVDLLEQIRTAHRPAEPAPVAEPETVQDQAGAVADEISQNLEAIIGEAEEPAVKPEPAPFRAELEATTKFVGLKFGTNGPNYSPSR